MLQDAIGYFRVFVTTPALPYMVRLAREDTGSTYNRDPICIRPGHENHRSGFKEFKLESMSGWASLSGYLYLKTGGGALSILKARKRMWCILEESQGRLLYFKNEEESINKPPLGYVELRGAAITLDMDNHNQFVILGENREIILTAENHESMMIWLMALQARRDQFTLAGKSRSSSASTDNDLDIDQNFLNVVESRERGQYFTPQLQRSQQGEQPFATRLLKHRVARLGGGAKTKSDWDILRWLRSASDLALMKERADRYLISHGAQTVGQHRPVEGTQSYTGGTDPFDNLGYLGHSPEWRRDQLRKMGATIDYGHPSEKYPPLHPLVPSSKQLSLSVENASRHYESLHALQPRQIQQPQSLTPPPSMLPLLKFTKSDSAANKSNGGGGGGGGEALVAWVCSSTSTSADNSDDVATEAGQHQMKQQSQQQLLPHNCYNGNDHAQVQNEHHHKLLHKSVVRSASDRGPRSMGSMSGSSQTLSSGNLTSEDGGEERVSELEKELIIRFTGTDTIDDAELYLFGGDRHKDRILELLAEARNVNPSLPTYEYLASGEVHVDCYGFKHQFADDGLLLHYLCQELSQHFLSQANTFERHQKNWLLYMKQHSKKLLSPKKDLKPLVRAGIPDPHRKQMWRAFVMSRVEDVVLEKGPHYYRTLCNSIPDSPTAARYKKQISLDLMRTMPSNVKFSTAGSKGIMDLQDVLLAFCIHNSTIGYCQGMNFLVAMALLFMDAQDAFWTLVAVTERYHSPAYFDHNLLGAQADQSVLHDLMAEKLPELTKHLDAIDIEISTVTLNWFLAIFFDAVPFQFPPSPKKVKTSEVKLVGDRFYLTNRH
ncbi:TBC1 domain family member 2b-like [Plakobranchus ocellatus]|uniref:TBC1 domain family member 2b-like n=1 Tax=Plakobranchus ocellatus TaxID=259542 RepID=A0AAV3ZE46_9GAST|nr:TBC1 domain family member 2b-like [Plakobranchus ocellatus]